MRDKKSVVATPIFMLYRCRMKYYCCHFKNIIWKPYHFAHKYAEITCRVFLFLEIQTLLYKMNRMMSEYASPDRVK